MAPPDSVSAGIGPTVFPVYRLLRMRRTTTNVGLCPRQEVMYSVTSTRFTVPAAVPAATVTCPAITTAVSVRTQFCATEVMVVADGARLALKAKVAVLQESDESVQAAAPEAAAVAQLTP